MYCILLYLAYVSDIYEELITTPREELEKIEQELKEENPGPLHSMLPERQPRQEAIDLFRARERKLNFDCPPTCTGNICTRCAHIN
jgi:hypothetical protein